MPFIKFTESRTVDDRHKGTPKEIRFEAGKVYELPIESCMRWKKRGVAVDSSAEEYNKLMGGTDTRSTRPARTTASSKPAVTIEEKPEAKAETKTEAKTDVKASDEEIFKAAKEAAQAGTKAALKVVADTMSKPSTQISIPDDWRSMSWPKMKVLASYFATDGIHNRPEAIKIIEAELTRRGV